MQSWGWQKGRLFLLVNGTMLDVSSTHNAEWLQEPIPVAVSTPAGEAAGNSVMGIGQQEVQVEEERTGQVVLKESTTPWVDTVANVTITFGLANEDGSVNTFAIKEVPVGLARMTRNNFKVPPLGQFWSSGKSLLWQYLRESLDAYMLASIWGRWWRVVEDLGEKADLCRGWIRNNSWVMTPPLPLVHA